MISPQPQRIRWRQRLAPLAGLYAFAMTVRNRRYDRKRGAARRVGVPVISVGNITVGGTGKTPVVIEIARRLLDFGRRPAILTRGYGAKHGQIPDEVAEFHEALPNVPVVVNADRVAGADAARREHGVDCLVLDDAFQHRRIARDLDVVLVDALDPWGGGRVLPAGLLREPLGGLRRAGVVIVTRVNQAADEDVRRIESEIRQHAPQATLLRAVVEPIEVVCLDGRRLTPASLRELRVQPVCGIGNPGSFARLLEPLCACVRQPLAFRDHYVYTEEDARLLAEAARQRGADLVLITRKDWSKLAPYWSREKRMTPLARLDVRVAIQDEGGAFAQMLRTAVGDA